MKQQKTWIRIMIILPPDVAIAASTSCRCSGCWEGQCRRHLLRVSSQPVNQSAEMGLSNVLIDGTAGTIPALLCLSLYFGKLDVGVGLGQRFGSTVCLCELYFLEQIWYCALISASELFWHIHIGQKWPNNWPHFQGLTSRNSESCYFLFHTQTLICQLQCWSVGAAEHWISHIPYSTV